MGVASAFKPDTFFSAAAEAGAIVPKIRHTLKTNVIKDVHTFFIVIPPFFYLKFISMKIINR
jgi:hypothetical protein